MYEYVGQPRVVKIHRRLLYVRFVIMYCCITSVPVAFYDRLLIVEGGV